MGPWLKEITVRTPGRALVEITGLVERELDASGAENGLLTLFVRHTSASLLIQENADPDVRDDLLSALERLAPADAPYVHTIEGPDDMPAHIKSVLTGVSLAVPVMRGRMTLGTWQGIYLAEHRAARHERRIVLHFAGTFAG